MNFNDEMQRLENGYRAGNGFSNLDLANENTQEPCKTAEEETAETELLNKYLNETYYAPERTLAIMDNPESFVEIYDKYKHDGIGFLNQFTALLEEKLEDLL